MIRIMGFIPIEVNYGDKLLTKIAMEIGFILELRIIIHYTPNTIFSMIDSHYKIRLIKVMEDIYLIHPRSLTV